MERETVHLNCEHEHQSLRDYFAGQALGGLLADHTLSGTNETYAKGAYDLADAMLEARKQK